ncbi:MAG: hypothetical protein IKW02_01575 [Clostridia bacterium]|nr:hypothetical protein [Clostridia bacterium]
MDFKMFVSDKKNLPIIIALVCALIVMALWGNGDKTEEKKPPDEYADNIEKRLERVLEKVDGAGKVSVFVALEDYGSTDFATDSRQITAQDRSESEQKIVMQGSGSALAPVAARVSLPKVKGVIVVAQGAKNEIVKENLAAAVEASMATMPHRIKILVGNN